MREAFHGQLEQLGVELATMCGLARTAMDGATTALLETDLPLAERVITDDDELNVLAARCEEHACGLLALQSPVARDLRTVVSGMRAAERVRRMGDLARHIAETVRRRHPEPVIPEQLADRFRELGRLASDTARNVQHSINTPEAVDTAAQELTDDRIDALQRELLTEIGRPGGPYSVRVAVDVALLSRFFERYADQAVGVTRQLDYAATGQMPHQSATPR